MIVRMQPGDAWRFDAVVAVPDLGPAAHKLPPRHDVTSLTSAFGILSRTGRCAAQVMRPRVHPDHLQPQLTWTASMSRLSPAVAGGGGTFSQLVLDPIFGSE